MVVENPNDRIARNAAEWEKQKTKERQGAQQAADARKQHRQLGSSKPRPS